MNAVIVSDIEEALPESFMKDWLRGVSRQLLDRKVMKPEQQTLEVSLVFLKEAEVKRLNWKYRGKDYPTDILSFANDETESLGEMVFCWPILQKQAIEHELSQEQELGYLMIHGILHLLGFDHETPGTDAEKMLELQDEIFEDMLAARERKAKPKPKPNLKAKVSVQAKGNVKANKKANENSAKATKLKLVSSLPDSKSGKSAASLAGQGLTKRGKPEKETKKARR